MSEFDVKDSKDPWRYMILLSKFMILVVDSGVVKSFGVLIPEMVFRYDSDYKTIGLMCGFLTFMYVTAPVTNFLMKFTAPKTLGIMGGLLAGASIICIPLTNSVYILGMLLCLAGFGNNLAFLPALTSVNDFFPRSFIFVDVLTHFGTPCGAFIVPVIIERSLEAYGYNGAFFILGGITLHVVVCAACFRRPKDFKPLDDILPKEDALIEPCRRPKGDTAEVHATLQSEQGHLLESQETPHQSGLTESDDPSELSADKQATSATHILVSQRTTLQSGQIESDDLSELCADKQATSSTQRLLQRCPLSRGHWLQSLTLFTEPLFTLGLPAIFLECYVLYAWMLFLVPYAECHGIIRSQAVLLSTLAGISGLFGKVIFLVLLHLNWNPLPIFILTTTVCASSFFIGLLSSTFVYLAGMACIQGFCLFLIRSFPIALVKLSVNNEKNLSSAFSLLLCAQALGSTIGDTVSGHIFDVTSCSILFISLGVLLVAMSVNLLLFFFINRKYGRARSTIKSNTIRSTHE